VSATSHTETECEHDWQSGGHVPGLLVMLPDVCMKCGALQEYVSDIAVIVTTFPNDPLPDEDRTHG
jgi:hypothetical protein